MVLRVIAFAGETVTKGTIVLNPAASLFTNTIRIRDYVRALAGADIASIQAYSRATYEEDGTTLKYPAAHVTVECLKPGIAWRTLSRQTVVETMQRSIESFSELVSKAQEYLKEEAPEPEQTLREG